MNSVNIHMANSISFDIGTLTDGSLVLEIKVKTQLPEYLIEKYTLEDGTGFRDTDNTGETTIKCFLLDGKLLSDVLDMEDAKELLHMIQSNSIQKNIVEDLQDAKGDE